MSDAFLTPRQAAQAVGVSESSIRRWCDQGRLAGERTAGGHRRIRLGALIEFARRSGIQLTPAGAQGARGRGGRQANEAVLAERTYELLIRGDDRALRSLIADLVDAGRSLAAICDRLLAPALSRIGHQWSTGELDVYQEHRATQLVIELLSRAKEFTPTPDKSAPKALCGALSDDIYAVATAMSALVLREVGWNATNLGPNTPVASICRAVDEVRPQLFALSVSFVADTDALIKDYRVLHAHTTRNATAVAVGGRALTQDVRRDIVADFFGDTMEHLVSFAGKAAAMLAVTKSKAAES